MPAHCRMRAFDRDLIRGGHYGQRSCEPHSKAEHMAAPTNAANVKKALANSEPSTHGTSRHFAAPQNLVAIGGIADIGPDWQQLARSLMTHLGHCCLDRHAPPSTINSGFNHRRTDEIYGRGAG